MTTSPIDAGGPVAYAPPMARQIRREDRERFGEADLGDAQAANPADDPDMIFPDADPLDTDVEDADLFLGLDDDDDVLSEDDL